MVTALIVSLICLAGYAGAYFLLAGGGGAKAKEKFEANLKVLQDAESTLKSSIEKSKDLVSVKQIEGVQAQLEALEASIAQERAQLEKIEGTLTKAQADVEVRETNHQNQKIAKEDEEQKLNSLLEKHESLSAESIELERSLAAAMKNLDTLLNETEMTDSQKGMLKELQSAMESAGARLRELIFEYEAVKTRVEMLRQQHLDLEEEYTRLVELQLG